MIKKLSVICLFVSTLSYAGMYDALTQGKLEGKAVNAISDVAWEMGGVISSQEKATPDHEYGSTTAATTLSPSFLIGENGDKVDVNEPEARKVIAGEVAVVKNGGQLHRNTFIAITVKNFKAKGIQASDKDVAEALDRLQDRPLSDEAIIEQLKK